VLLLRLLVVELVLLEVLLLLLLLLLWKGLLQGLEWLLSGPVRRLRAVKGWGLAPFLPRWQVLGGFQPSPFPATKKAAPVNTSHCSNCGSGSAGGCYSNELRPPSRAIPPTPKVGQPLLLLQQWGGACVS
jgi:hypothetical protein